MLSTAIFPLEIEETILNFLADEDDDAQTALKACALVCHAFLTICRTHIFRRIVLADRPGVPPWTTNAFERVLCEKPEIADQIRDLDYTVRVGDLTSPSFREAMKRITRLQFLTVRDSGGWAFKPFNWSDNPIRPTLLHLLHLPTLTYFNVNIKNFVVSDLIPCINLKCLHIGSCTTGAAETIMFPGALPKRLLRLNEIVAEFGTETVLRKLCIPRRPNGQSLIDFGSLSKLKMVLNKPTDGELSQELFRHCQKLTNVHLSFWKPEDVRPSLSDMLRPSMQTLKHIVVEIHVDDDVVDPPFGIPFDLGIMRAQNIIESIAVVVHSGAYYRQVLDWRRLDEVLTTPGWFSLRRVSLVINIALGNRLEVALRKLPETQLQRLSASNSISFDFEVNTLSY